MNSSNILWELRFFTWQHLKSTLNLRFKLITVYVVMVTENIVNDTEFGNQERAADVVVLDTVLPE